MQGKKKRPQSELQQGWGDEDVTYVGKYAKDLSGCASQKENPDVDSNLKQQQKKVTWGSPTELRRLGALGDEPGWATREKESPALPKCLITSVQRYHHTQKGLEDNFAISLFFFFPSVFPSGEEDKRGKWREGREIQPVLFSWRTCLCLGLCLKAQYSPCWLL